MGKKLMEYISTATGVELVKHTEFSKRTRTLIEPDVEFFDSLEYGIEAPRYINRNNLTMFDVSTVCNKKCDYCYAEPNRLPQKSIEQILVDLKRVTNRTVILMGAEPTTRKDLPELVRAINAAGKRTFLFSNGIKLKDPKYVRELVDAGIRYFEISVDPRKPMDGLTAAQNVRAAGDGLLGALSITLRNLDDLGVVDAITGMSPEIFNPWQIRVRLPSEVGDFVPVEQKLWMSDLYNALGKPQMIPGDNNLYHVNVRSNGQRMRLIRWPSRDEMYSEFLQDGPYALFNSGPPANFIKQILATEKILEKVA
jgi:hypothetical protein